MGAEREQMTFGFYPRRSWAIYATILAVVLPGSGAAMHSPELGLGAGRGAVPLAKAA